jgi:hypothetical protein
MKKVVKYLEENNKAGEVDGFKTNIQKVQDPETAAHRYLGNNDRTYPTKIS